jgi:hypothetical protein
MILKNLSNHPLGFGEVIILPDETKKLPGNAGFNADHPMVKHLIATKRVEVVVTRETVVKVAVPSTTSPTTDLTAEANDNDVAAQKAKYEDMLATASNGRATRAQLNDLATELNVEQTTADTNATLSIKIVEFLQAEILKLG